MEFSGKITRTQTENVFVGMSRKQTPQCPTCDFDNFFLATILLFFLIEVCAIRLVTKRI